MPLAILDTSAMTAGPVQPLVSLLLWGPIIINFLSCLIVVSFAGRQRSCIKSSSKSCVLCALYHTLDTYFS